MHANSQSGGRLGLALALGLACGLRAGADTVTLKSGAVLTGEILKEDAYELTLRVSRTANGEIQTLKVIDQSLVANMERGQPRVALEPLPGTDDASAAPPPPADTPPDTLEGWRQSLRRADALIADGRNDEAATLFREVTTQAEAAPGADDTRVEILEVREEASRHLLIALQGKLELKEETLKTANAAAQRLERRIRDQREEREDLDRPPKTSDEPEVRRLGKEAERLSLPARRKELDERIAVEERRLQTHQRWAAEERRAIVSLESEIKVAQARARQAADDLSTALRDQRTRR